jgi:xylitol oxidase
VQESLEPRTNWAGNVRFGARHFHRPASIEELRHVVGTAGGVRPLGTGHSFNRIADGTDTMVSVDGLPAECDIDAAAGVARVSAGLRYGEVAVRLHAAGWALPNLGSLPHISVAGACATGTHGSGDANGCLATSVVGLELVTADGDLLTTAGVDGAAVGLGALGVVTHLRLRLVPSFEVAQHVYDGVPVPDDPATVDELFGAGYSVSLFTRWTGAAENQAWVKRRAGQDRPVPQRWLGGTLADGPRHPVPGASPEFCSAQLGEPGPWYERLPHFRLEFTPSAGDELQSEYLVPRDRAVEAIRAVAAMGDRISPVLHVSELRTVAADDLWLSPAYRRDSLAVHFTWRSEAVAVATVLAEVERRLSPLGARPHWGKLFGMPMADVRGRYERFDDFAALVRRLDPAGKFRNAWLADLLGD